MIIIRFRDWSGRSATVALYPLRSESDVYASLIVMRLAQAIYSFSIELSHDGRRPTTALT